MPCGSYIGSLSTVPDSIRGVKASPDDSVHGSGTCLTYSDTAVAAYAADYDLDALAWNRVDYAYFNAAGTQTSGGIGSITGYGGLTYRCNNFSIATACIRNQYFINIPVQYSIIDVATSVFNNRAHPSCDRPIILQGCSGQTGGCGGDWIETGVPALPPNNTCTPACPMMIIRFVVFNNPSKTNGGVAPFATLADLVAACVSGSPLAPCYEPTLASGWNKGACYGNHQDPFTGDEDP
jgi:hypothetical protein